MWVKLGQQLWEWRGVLLPAPSVAALLIALRLTGWIQPLEWAALDQFFRLRPLEPGAAQSDWSRPFSKFAFRTWSSSTD